MHKQIQERNDFDKKIKNLELQIKQKLNNFDWYILVKLLKRNFKKKKTLWSLFVNGVQLPHGYRAISRRQLTFYHYVPRNFW